MAAQFATTVSPHDRLHACENADEPGIKLGLVTFIDQQQQRWVNSEYSTTYRWNDFFEQCRVSL